MMMMMMTMMMIIIINISTLRNEIYTSRSDAALLKIDDLLSCDCFHASSCQIE